MPPLKNVIEQFFALLIAAKVFNEVFNNPIRFIEVAAACVRGNIAVWHGPERMIGRQGFGICDIQVRSRKAAGVEIVHQGLLVRGSAASDAVITSASLQLL